MYFIGWYTYQIFGGGDFELSKSFKRSLSFHPMVDTRANRLDSVSHSASAQPVAAIPPSNNVA